jgi:hypothetical protein
MTSNTKFFIVDDDGIVWYGMVLSGPYTMETYLKSFASYSAARKYAHACRGAFGLIYERVEALSNRFWLQ